MSISDSTLSSRLVATLLAALIVAYCVLAYWANLPAAWVGHLTDLAWTGFSLAAGLRSLRTARRETSPRRRSAWQLFGIAALAWSAGIVYLMVRQTIDPTFPPYPTLANYLFVALAPLFTAGLYRLKPQMQTGTPAATRRLANLILIACTISLIAVLALLEPMAGTDRSTEFIAFSILDPTAFSIAAIFGLACLWILGLDTSHRAGALLVAAISVHAVVDLIYFWSILSARGDEVLLEWTWLVAFALQFLAAREHDRRQDTASPWLGTLHAAPRGALHAMVPSTLILVGGGALILFRDSLSVRVLWISLPLLTIFAVVLAVREWSTHRQEQSMYQRVADSEARFRRLLTASPAIVFSCSTGAGYPATFISPNAETALGLPPSDASLWADRVHPDDRAAEREEFHAAARRGASQSRYRLRDGQEEYRWVYRKVSRIAGGEEQADLLVGSIVDVTESKRLEDQLFQSQRMEALGHLAGGVAHDFNNLLTSILGYSQLALLDDSLPPEQQANLRSIEDAGRKAATMTKHLLAFSSRQTLQLTPIDVKQTVREFADVLFRLIPEDIEIAFTAPPDRVVALSDHGHLEQIVMNLALNARDAMPEGGRLELDVDLAVLDQDLTTGAALAEATRFAVITVADSGDGMSAEVQSTAFEPFFTTKDRSKGTGLGLAIVHGIVRQHGGHIELESREGEGTTFRVYLPATEGDVARKPRAEDRAMVQGSERLLIVEDDAAIARLLSEALRSAGYAVETADSGTAALDLLRRSADDFDLVLTDVVMPGLNGRELADAIRRERLASRIVYMSGYADDTRLLREIASGGAPLLRKPLRLRDLTQTLRDALDAPAPRDV